MKILNNVDADPKDIGKGTKIWHFARVGARSKIGENCIIGTGAVVDYDVEIGNNCKIESNCYIAPLTLIGDGVFLGPDVVITNDPYPMSEKMLGVVIKDNVIIGAGSRILAGITIEEGAVVGMGSVVTKDVSKDHVVWGCPARVKGLREDYENKKTKYENKMRGP